jgi:hypothetical protein
MTPGLSAREQLHAALCDAYDLESLAQMVRFRLEKTLQANNLPAHLHLLVNINQLFGGVVFDLMGKAEQGGWVGDLIAEAHRFIPGNGPLRRYCEEHAPAALVATDPAYGVRTVEEGFRVLERLMDNPTIHDAAIEFRTVFGRERDNVETLANYKELHDGLHDLQFRYAGLVEREAGKGADGMSGVALENYETDLRDLNDRLSPVAARVQTARWESSWLRKLGEATSLVRRGREERNPQSLWKAKGKMEEMLATEPSRIYNLLTLAFTNLRMRELVTALKRICDAADKSALPVDNVRRYRASLARLSGLERSLGELVAEHGDWQQIDNNLNVLRRQRADDHLEDGYAPAGPSDNGPPDRAEADESEGDPWQVTERLLLRLCDRSGEAWAQELKRSVTQFSNARGSKQPLAEPLYLVHYKAVKRFFNVDKQLNKLCEELKQIGERLVAVLEVLDSDPAKT